VADEDRVGERDVVGEKLIAEIRAGVDEQRLVGSLVADMDRKSCALDADFAGVLTGVAVAFRRRRPRRVTGPEQRDVH